MILLKFNRNLKSPNGAFAALSQGLLYLAFSHANVPILPFAPSCGKTLKQNSTRIV